MILVDTGPLVAFFDASDNYHKICIDTVFTLDHRDFSIYRLAGSKRLKLLPRTLIS